MINDKLWAVKFSYIPYIQEINYIPDESIPMGEEIGQLLDIGVILLNKENQAYEVYKEWFCKIMDKSNRQIKKILLNDKSFKNKNKWQSLYIEMLKIEQKRRKIKG